MLRKPIKTTARFSALFACSILGLASTSRTEAQEAPVAPAAPIAPATLNRLFAEAEKAFTDKDYLTAVAKIEELLKALGTNKDAPLELLYFNIGLGNLLAAKPAEAKTLGRMIGAVQKAAVAVKAALKPDGIIVTQFNGAPAGQTVFHLHFHIIPRYEGVALAGHGHGNMADMAELKTLAAQISAAL